MSLISFSNISDGTTIDAADVNTPFNTIYNDYNGGITATNLASNAVTTAKIADDNVTDAKLIYGKVRSRQGGNASNWAVAGTTTFDTSATDVFIQTGVIGTNAGADTTVTFPTAFTQKPIVILSVYGGNAGDTAITANSFAECTGTISTTTFVCRTINTSGTQTNQAVSWMAIGV